jgi:Spy/CpxP family protein refolding chaperone
MSKCTLILLGLVAAGLWSVPIQAQSPESLATVAMMGDGPVLAVFPLLRFGDLTAEQQSRVRQIAAADSIAMRALFDQLAESNNQLAHTLLMPGDTQAQDANRIVKRLAQLRLQLMQKELRTVMAIRSVLTKEQLVKVGAVMDEMQNTGTAQARPLAGLD